MITVIYGDLLDVEDGIICHQTHADGTMVGGLAKNIAEKYPNVEKAYKDLCVKYNIYGSVVFINAKNNVTVANMCCQRDQSINSDFVDYDSMEFCFNKILEFAMNNKKNVYIPYGIGCGLANGNWEKVSGIISRVFKESRISCFVIIKK